MDVLTITNHPLKQIMSLESPVAPTMKKNESCIFGIHNTFAHPKLLLFWLLRLERRWHGPWETNIQDDHNCTALRKRDQMLDVNKSWSSKAIFKLFSSCLTLTFQANSLFDRSSLHHNFFSVTLQFAFFSRISHFVVVVVHMYNIVLQMLFNTF